MIFSCIKSNYCKWNFKWALSCLLPRFAQNRKIGQCIFMPIILCISWSSINSESLRGWAATTHAIYFFNLHTFEFQFYVSSIKLPFKLNIFAHNFMCKQSATKNNLNLIILCTIFIWENSCYFICAIYLHSNGLLVL